ncbi:MAG: hypothetical protein KJ558_13580, partial [Gammaproteobacteria bacterium]|nr:hypothetical protein [Gammaproteobacteria bacterium]
LSGNKLDNIALRFRSDLVDLIEQNRLFSRQSRSHRRGSGSAAKQIDCRSAKDGLKMRCEMYKLFPDSSLACFALFAVNLRDLRNLQNGHPGHFARTSYQLMIGGNT